MMLNGLHFTVVVNMKATHCSAPVRCMRLHGSIVQNSEMNVNFIFLSFHLFLVLLFHLCCFIESNKMQQHSLTHAYLVDSETAVEKNEGKTLHRRYESFLYEKRSLIISISTSVSSRSHRHIISFVKCQVL